MATAKASPTVVSVGTPEDLTDDQSLAGGSDKGSNCCINSDKRVLQYSL